MRGLGTHLLLSLLLTWRVHSSSDLQDVGSGAGPVPTRGSSVANHKFEGSGAGRGGVVTDDEDDSSSTTVTTTTTAAATTAAASATMAAAAISSSAATKGHPLAGSSEDGEGSGAGTDGRRCDSSGCFCVDERNVEIANTRGRTSCTPVDEEPIVPRAASTYGSPMLPSSSSSSPAVTVPASTFPEVNEEIDIDAQPAVEASPVIHSSSSSAAATTTTTQSTTTQSTSTAQPTTTAATTTTATASSAAIRKAATSPATVPTTGGRSSTSKMFMASRQAVPSSAKTVPPSTTAVLSNFIPVDPTGGPVDPEEPNNEIGSAVPINSLESHDADASLHPGLLAAIIGGGVVGLLCAILLIMFIVYRMRKKDEGSYPLDDGKPRMAYAGKSSSSKEFYA